VKVFAQVVKALTVNQVELLISESPIDYEVAINFMNQRVSNIQGGDAPEALWLLEHPTLYTAGTSAKKEDHLGTLDIPVYETGRGGQFTYHGPGQRVAYVMLDLSKRSKDVRAFISKIERWATLALGEFSLLPKTYSDRVGLWVDTPSGEEKIAAIGVRLKKWVSLHGISINVSPDLNHFRGIVPCGISDKGVTSLEALGLPVSMADLDVALIKHFQTCFGAPLTEAQSLDI